MGPVRNRFQSISGVPEPTAVGPATVRPSDIRYDGLLRGNNFRFVGRPDEIRVVGSTEQVVSAVADAVRSERRVAVRSGGHCFENFTADPTVRMLVELSPMNAVGYDASRRAFAVQPGATLGHVFRTLFTGWGVTIPAGGCPEVGAGGHFAGGGYGPLSRRYGSVVDHLYGVEVVVVGRDGAPRVVEATREAGDPYSDLWWAHTGGGGGNFGVVTRYWLRSPGATETDASQLLPPTPGDMLESVVIWAWDQQMTQQAFSTLLRNFGIWHERNSAPESAYTGLYAIMIPLQRSAGRIMMVVQIDAGIPGADAMVTDFVSAITASACRARRSRSSSRTSGVPGGRCRTCRGMAATSCSTTATRSAGTRCPAAFEKSSTWGSCSARRRSGCATTARTSERRTSSRPCP